MGKKSKNLEKTRRKTQKEPQSNRILNNTDSSNFNYLNYITVTSSAFEDTQISLLEDKDSIRNLTHKETNELMYRFLLDAEKLSEEEIMNKIETDTCFKNMWLIAKEADENLPEKVLEKPELPKQSFKDKYANNSTGKHYCK